MCQTQGRGVYKTHKCTIKILDHTCTVYTVKPIIAVENFMVVF